MGRSQKSRVLIVDDEVFFLEAIDEILGEVSQRSALTVFLETCHAAGARRRKAMARAPAHPAPQGAVTLSAPASPRANR